MKNAFRYTALAAALIAQPFAFATDTDKPAAKKAPSIRMEAIRAVSKELTLPFKAGAGNPIPHLEKMVAQPHSPAMSAKLMAAFGMPTLIAIKPVDAAPGMRAYAVSLPAQSFAEVDGESMAWSAMESKMELDKDGRTMVWNGAWPSLTVKDATTNIAMTDMQMASTQQRTSNNLWIGKASFKIAQMVVGVANETAGTLEGLDIAATVSERGKLVDVGYNVQIKAFKVAGEQVDDIRIRTSVTNADMKAFEAMSMKGSIQSGPLASQDPFGGQKKEFIALAKSAAARGTTINIEEMSASFRGHRTAVSGKMSLAPVKDADFKTGAAFAKKIIARFDVKVPVALVNEIAGIMTRKQAKAKGQEISDATVAQTSQMIADGMIGKLVSTGFVTRQDDMLLATAEFKAGKLTVNSKVVDLPKTKPAPKSAAVK